ncbi:MAG: class I SAM-dependent methyltransferase, partial [Thermodesulfovibrionia bacterium]|nr:class I SAM-dependent methyltransferase [Thermodesulfovibrionia bacterium]
METVHDKLLSTLACPICNEKLEKDSSSFKCTGNSEHVFPVIRDIPRFVASDDYVDSFSFEWNTHNRTQLDSFRNDDSSKQQFIKTTGFSADQLKGKLVLDAGIGAGRYSDIVSRWGALVVGIDLSYAVEAARANFNDRQNVLVVQADISKLPF